MNARKLRATTTSLLPESALGLWPFGSQNPVFGSAFGTGLTYATISTYVTYRGYISHSYY